MTVSTQALRNSGYVVTSSSRVTLTLPASATCSVGDTVRVSGAGAGGWTLAANDGQLLVKAGSSNAAGAWTARDTDRAWISVASSADGRRLVAAERLGQIYTSADFGVTWTPRETDRIWFSVVCSADGTKLAAVVTGGQIHTSADTGATWTARESDRNWSSIASSADGAMLVAAVNGGQVYTSADSGATWTARLSIGGWRAVASSADGTRLFVVYGNAVGTSMDSGVTWTLPMSGPEKMYWQAIICSADRTKLVAIRNDLISGDPTAIYTSTDYGVRWVPVDVARHWVFVCSSADGAKLVAVVYGRRIYTSGSLASGHSLTGEQFSAIELQYVGSDTFMQLSSTGTIVYTW